MTNKKRSSKTSKLKNFLVTGSIEEDEGGRDAPVGSDDADDCGPAEELQEEEVVIEDIIDTEVSAGESPPEPALPYNDGTAQLVKEIAQLRQMVAALSEELVTRTTSKEQLKEYSSIVGKRDAETANKKFMVMLEQLSAMREDFFKLCKGINSKLDSFSPKGVLSSFEAYGVDMENILVDCGVQIGPTGFEKLNTIHQRIVDVIPTDDESKNGMIAERVSDGYLYQGRVLQKEKVKIYKFSENGKTEGDVEK